jgi:hypothetical protein
MKPSIWILISLLLVAALAACQPGPVGTQPAGEVAPVEYPDPQQELVVAVPASVLYPDPQSGDEVLWAQAYAMLLNGEVSQILGADTEKITLVLKDGRSLLAAQPAPGDILRMIETCGEVCAQIQIGTE